MKRLSNLTLAAATMAAAAIVGAAACSSAPSRATTATSKEAPTRSTTYLADATTSTTMTTRAASTTTTSAAPASSIAIWPTQSGSKSYTDPVEAARAFATGYVGFVSPVVGPFRQGDSRSGEVDLRPNPRGPVTIVLLRQLSADSTWSVLGATTANIRPVEPAALAEVSSPVTLKGTSTAFEGTVQTEVRQDRSNQPLGHGFVNGGGGNSGLGAYSGRLAFARPAAKSGALLLYTLSAENGQVREAAVLRIRFAGA